MTENEKTKNTPALRFKGFTDDLEQRKLGDVAKFINGRAYAQNELLPSGKYKVLRVGNFYTNDSWYYSDLELDNKYYANDGDLLYTWSATFGPHIWRGDRVIYHYHIWKIDLTDELEEHFAVQLLERDKDEILSGHNGSTMAHITKDGMEQKEVIIPKSIEEQRQLGLFFERLDNLITLHQKEVSSLQIVKKSMLEKMFPKEGAKVPEIRFSGFTDDWEQRKLGDITTSYSGGTPTAGKSEYYGGDIPFIRSGEISSDHTELFLTEEGLNNSSATMVKVGDILYALYGATSGEVSISRLNGAINQAILAIIPNQGYDANFIMQWLQNNKSSIISTYLQGGQGNLSATIVKQLQIDLPSYEEQEQIGQFFYSLNKTITLHQKEADKFTIFKKSLLTGMFPK
jgi:type I restriction enzyme S subunit